MVLSFGGFPNYHKNDQFNMFYKLFKRKEISREHYKNILNLKKFVILNEKIKIITKKYFYISRFFK